MKTSLNDISGMIHTPYAWNPSILWNLWEGSKLSHANPVVREVHMGAMSRCLERLNPQKKLSPFRRDFLPLIWC